MLRAKSQHGILDKHLFHDNVHPTLVGHVALAEAVLGRLQGPGCIWLAGIDAGPRLDPQRCADEFGIDAAAWATVCERTAAFYGRLAFLAVDPAERCNGAIVTQWRRAKSGRRTA